MPVQQLQFSTMRMSEPARIAWDYYNKSKRILKFRQLNLKDRSASNV
jgi:hypothetical protein